MNVASLALCKELFRLSEWDDTRDDWLPNKEGKYEVRGGAWYSKNPRIPAYDLGYLLRKLPPLGYKDDDPIADSWLTLELAGDKWSCGHKGWDDTVEADTPEDAACRLCVELFKHGVLKRE